MNRNDTQPRHPSGSPQGGQWATGERADAGLTLAPERPADTTVLDEAVPRFAQVFGTDLRDVEVDEYDTDDTHTFVMRDGSKEEGWGPHVAIDVDQDGRVVACGYSGIWRGSHGEERQVTRDCDGPADISEFIADSAWATKVQRGLDRQFNDPVRDLSPNPDLPPEVELRVGNEPRLDGGSNLIVIDRATGMENTFRASPDGYIRPASGQEKSFRDARRSVSGAAARYAVPGNFDRLAFASVRKPDLDEIRHAHRRTSQAVAQSASFAAHRAVHVEDTGREEDGVRSFVLRARDKSFVGRLDVQASGRIENLTITPTGGRPIASGGLEPGELGRFLRTSLNHEDDRHA